METCGRRIAWQGRTSNQSHHTTSKGDLGVLKAQVLLFEQGFTICAPLAEHAPFDLVAYRNGGFRRVQVKYRSLDKHGKLPVQFSNCWSDGNGIHTVPIDKDAVDICCVNCAGMDKCYNLNPKAFGSTVCLRVETPKNGQAKGVYFAADYRRAP